jgi:hypothetical protein
VTTRGGVRPDLTEFDTTLAILNIDGDELGSLVLDLENAVDPAWVTRLGPVPAVATTPGASLSPIGRG